MNDVNTEVGFQQQALAFAAVRALRVPIADGHLLTVRRRTVAHFSTEECQQMHRRDREVVAGEQLRV